MTHSAARPLSEKTVSQIGNQARGETGRRIWMTGLNICQARLLAPIEQPERDADRRWRGRSP